MNWREPTPDDIAGKGDYRYIIDIIPDHVPHQATTDGDALIRVSNHGWAWQVLDVGQQPPKFLEEGGYATDRYLAIAQAMEYLGKLRT